ncbi:hypothetical protein Dda3937_04508 [Dickeya dadantii 3937]|uniref:Uncharacterized protein n=1 Tax=Dickeya dadantii (strain 3937) TaxID=198628 RepID=E0SFW5_DICD3|nr:hypothetical protein Dda3937_04508 [Dickeya dadantii 3937]
MLKDASAIAHAAMLLIIMFIMLTPSLYPSYFKLQVCWLYYSAHRWASPLRGRCQQGSNRLAPICRSPQSLTYVSSWGLNERHPVSHRRPAVGWSNSFPTNLSLGCRVTRLIMSLVLKGQRNSNYFG